MIIVPHSRNPNANMSINPNANMSINPNANMSINPNANMNFNGMLSYSLQFNIESYLISNNQN